LFVNGDPESSKLILRDLMTKSLHRMLSHQGNPTMSNISAVFTAVKRQFKVGWVFTSALMWPN
jgi:hypothetical protein